MAKIIEFIQMEKLNPKKENKMNNDEFFLNQWRDLGFFFDLDNRPEVGQWRFYGSKAGLNKLSFILATYVSDLKNAKPGEHEHYGPYWNFKITTSDVPQITAEGFQGSLDNLNTLKNILEHTIEETTIGMSSVIEYGEISDYSARIFVMSNDFKPESLDELIVSNRQIFVNRLREKKGS